MTMNNLFMTSLLQSGLEFWEANQLAQLSRDTAETFLRDSIRLRKRAEWYRSRGGVHWTGPLKDAIKKERRARSFFDRARRWREIANSLEQAGNNS